MIQRYLLIIAAAMAAILSACSDDSLFVVEGRLADGVDRQISLSFFDGNGYKVMKTTPLSRSTRAPRAINPLRHSTLLSTTMPNRL
ncbi:MAG: hypothetical protein HFJ93_05395 [Muribaculaceae bacterium]|nr:hypothetical protein [Muribaculaceae bacterium]